MESVVRGLANLKGAERWDFDYHDPAYTSLVQNLDSRYPTVRFGDIITLMTDMGAFSLYKTEYFVDEGIPFLRVQNVQEYGVDLTKDTKYISHEYHEQLEKSQLQPDDLLLTTKAVIGVAAVVDEGLGECNMSQNLVRIRLADGINPSYLAVFLNSRLGRTQTETASTGPNQKYLNFGRIRDLIITLPPRPIQDQIAAIMQEAYATRQAMLAEAEALREGVDEYVLSELGIEWNVIPDVRRFVVSSKELLGGRFDAGHQSPQAEQALELLKESGHTVVELGDIIEVIHYGASIKNKYFDEGIPFIRIGNLKPNELDISDIVFLSESVRKQIGKAFVEAGDLLMSRSGSVGIVACVPPDADGFAFGSYQIKFRLKAETAKPEYIAYVLNSPLGIAQTQQQKTGAVQMNITIPGIKAIRVPIPDSSVQEHIVQAADNRRLRAAELQCEAEAVITRAKVKVEGMILEEDEDGVE
jgi:type I restriction enzyme S subunit